jgi:hypothetical protein
VKWQGLYSWQDDAFGKSFGKGGRFVTVTATVSNGIPAVSCKFADYSHSPWDIVIKKIPIKSGIANKIKDSSYLSSCTDYRSTNWPECKFLVHSD